VWYRPLALSELLRCWFCVRHLEFVVVALSVLSEVQFDIAICVRRLVLPKPKLLSLASLAHAPAPVRASGMIRLDRQLDITSSDIASFHTPPTHYTSTIMSAQPLITFKAGQCEFIVSAPTSSISKHILTSAAWHAKPHYQAHQQAWIRVPLPGRRWWVILARLSSSY
jgi:hypothetical protein